MIEVRVASIAWRFERKFCGGRNARPWIGRGCSLQESGFSLKMHIQVRSDAIVSHMFAKVLPRAAHEGCSTAHILLLNSSSFRLPLTRYESHPRK